jgi:hypothetical protein
MGNQTSARGRRVAKHACPRHAQHTNATTEAEVAPNYTPQRRYEGECPLCGEAGKLVVEPRQERGYAPWRVWCRKASCCDLSPGEWLRELAKTVGAPGGWHLLDNAPEYLSGYLDSQVRTDREPGQLPSPASIHGRHSRLWTVTDAIDYLLRERGLTEHTIRQNELGWESDPPAFTFPVYDAQGELVNVVRRPWPDAEPGRKYVSLPGRNRTNAGIQLYPDVPSKGPLLLCEGLFDALLGRQHGLQTVTSSQGVNSFLDEWLPLFSGRTVAVMFDVGAEKVMRGCAAALCAAGAEAWPVRLRLLLGEGEGKDLSDYLNGSGTVQELRELINREHRRARP